MFPLQKCEPLRPFFCLQIMPGYLNQQVGIVSVLHGSHPSLPDALIIVCSFFMCHMDIYGAFLLTLLLLYKIRHQWMKFIAFIAALVGLEQVVVLQGPQRSQGLVFTALAVPTQNSVHGLPGNSLSIDRKRLQELALRLILQLVFVEVV